MNYKNLPTLQIMYILPEPLITSRLQEVLVINIDHLKDALQYPRIFPFGKTLQYL